MSPCSSQINFKFCFTKNIEFLLSQNIKVLCLPCCALILCIKKLKNLLRILHRQHNKPVKDQFFFQHLCKFPRTNRPVTALAHSTPRNHCHENNHQLSLTNFKIIDSANNEDELRILESIYICKEKPFRNIDQSATPHLVLVQPYIS